MLGHKDEYDSIYSLENDHWWYRCLHEKTIAVIQKYFPDKNCSILDAGCGTGGLLHQLEKAGHIHLTGTDISDFAIEYSGKKTKASLSKSDLDDFLSGTSLQKYDVVVFNDVLYFFSAEKIKSILQKASNTLNENGIIIINLPAGQFFRGNHDKAVGIIHRFSKGEFLKLIPPDMKVERVSYWPFLLSPVIVIKRVFDRFLNNKKTESDLKPVSPFLNNWLYKITSAEDKYFPYAASGSSLFLVLKKP